MGRPFRYSMKGSPWTGGQRNVHTRKYFTLRMFRRYFVFDFSAWHKQYGILIITSKHKSCTEDYLPKGHGSRDQVQ